MLQKEQSWDNKANERKIDTSEEGNEQIVAWNEHCDHKTHYVHSKPDN